MEATRCYTCLDPIPYEQRREFYRCPQCKAAFCAKHAQDVLDLGFCPSCGKDVEK